MIDVPVISTARLNLRLPEPHDVAPMLGFFQSTRAEFYGGPLCASEGWRRLAAYAGQWLLRGYGFYSVTRRDTGEVIGMTGPYHPQNFPEPEMSWLLTDQAHEGQGFAQEACTAVLAHLFQDLGWTSVVSYIDTENTASRALALRLGAAPDPTATVPLPGCAAFRHWPGGVAP